MGEAKRRKQLLGEDYGKQTQMIIRGSDDLEQHVERFFEAWYQYLRDLIPEDLSANEPPLDPAEVSENQEKTRQWVHDYIQTYRPQERNRLACGILNPVYAEFGNIFEEQKSEEEGMEEIMAWMVEASSLLGLLRPYISPQNQKQYQEPLQGFYDLTLTENEGREDGEAITLLKKLFADALDL